MDEGNIMKRGRVALVNYGYETYALKNAEARRGGDFGAAYAERLKRQAVNVRMVGTALARLSERERLLLDGAYITGGPGAADRTCAALGCGEDDLEDMTAAALRSFCAVFFGLR